MRVCVHACVCVCVCVCVHACVCASGYALCSQHFEYGSNYDHVTMVSGVAKAGPGGHGPGGPVPGQKHPFMSRNLVRSACERLAYIARCPANTKDLATLLTMVYKNSLLGRRQSLR